MFTQYRGKTRAQLACEAALPFVRGVLKRPVYVFEEFKYPVSLDFMMDEKTEEGEHLSKEGEKRLNELFDAHPDCGVSAYRNMRPVDGKTQVFLSFNGRGIQQALDVNDPQKGKNALIDILEKIYPTTAEKSTQTLPIRPIISPE